MGNPLKAVAPLFGVGPALAAGAMSPKPQDVPPPPKLPEPVRMPDPNSPAALEAARVAARKTSAGGRQSTFLTTTAPSFTARTLGSGL